MPINARISRINQLDFPPLLEYFEIELAALNRSRATKKVYLSSIQLYLRWLDENGHEPDIDRRLVQAWMAEMLENGAAPTTVAARLAGVRQFTKWLANENEIPADPLLRLNAPKAPIAITPVLKDEEIHALIRACQGDTLRCKRDEAMVRLFLDSGIRIGECMGLTLDDIDLGRGLVKILKTKNGHPRISGFKPKTARSLGRYLRARKGHRSADSTALWLGARTYRPLSEAGFRLTLKDRAEQAGIEHLHPHQFRHTWAANVP